MADRLKEVVATCFYVGYLPWMPGTFGSIAAAAVFIMAGKPVGPAGWIAFAGMIVLSAVALSGAQHVFGARDPKPAVLDEFAGMWLAFLCAGTGSWASILASFVLFRALDILKPVGIRRLERLPGWLGILADDLAAGLAAGVIVRLAIAALGLWA